MNPTRHEPRTDFAQSWQRNACFGCGPANPQGLHLEFTLAPGGKSYICQFQIGDNFSGPPGHAHGGIIATILDETMGKALKLKGVVAVTTKLQVEYLRPVPLNQPLIAEGHHRRTSGRVLYNFGEIRNERGKVLARAKGQFYVIDPEKMFARELAAERGQQ